MPTIDDFLITERKREKKTDSKKKRSPWDTLDDFAKNLTKPTSKGKETKPFEEPPRKAVSIDEPSENHIYQQNSIQKGIHKSTQKGIQKAIHNRIQKGSEEKEEYTKKIQKVYKKDEKGIQNSIQSSIQVGGHTASQGNQLTNLEIIYSLSGIKKKILFLLVDICFENGSLVTCPINCKEIAKTIGAKYPTVKQSIQRLKEDKLIFSEKQKRGRGGFACFRITEQVKFNVLENKKTNHIAKESVSEKVYEKDYNRYTERNTEWDTMLPVVSSSKNTITTEEENSSIDDFLGELNNIDISPLEKVGFTKSHLAQLKSEYTKNPEQRIPSELIQESINYLAFDLRFKNLEEIFHKGLAAFVSMLKKGQVYSSCFPDKYKTPQQEANEKYLALKESERKAKIEIENKIKQLELYEWQDNLSEEELLDLCPMSDISMDIPEKLRKTARRKRALANAVEYFETEIWPIRKREVIC